jgi:hypothetical protein
MMMFVMCIKCFDFELLIITRIVIVVVVFL